jgi:predicted ATPase/class 3 adenylate cyclase
MSDNLPSGTITFLFTDIEGSTKLAQQYPGKWESLRTRHHAILRSAIESENGYIFQIIGDAFCAAFHTAGDALQAAIKSQTDLHAKNWGDTPVKVRMGIHTGKGEIQEGGDYSGYVTLCRVQRLMSAGHGGQTLLSQTTQDLVRDELPPGLALRDLGERRLKDLTRPEHIFQLLIPGLPADFPPLKTLDTFSNNLPVQLTSFIGREKEIGEVKRLLNEKRLVTLTGSGGTGKTRLALQTAADLLDSFPNGAWLVELAPLSDPDLVPQAVASALGVREQPGRSMQDTLTDYLREKKLLLILDNCEHLIEACAVLADMLLHACPGLKILATSREALGIAGEVPFRVPSLSTPDTGHLPPIPTLLQYEAVRLFSERAATVFPSFTVTDDNASALSRVCRRLDGIPLAIELAAARVRMLSVEQIAARLDDCFRILTGGSRTALPRLQTLRALIDWSYDLLSESERLLLRRLSVFAGGWLLEAAEAVCADEVAGMDVLGLLTQLVNKSLVVVDYEQEQDARYRLLETVRQYACEKLAETGEGERVRTRHLAYFLQFAEEASPHLFRTEQLDWLRRLEMEHDNLRAALEWALDGAEDKPPGPPEAGLRLANALFRFWLMRALCRALGDKPGIASALRLKGFQLFLDHNPSASLFFEESLVIYRELGDKSGIASTLYNLGQIAQVNVYDIPAARHFYEESLKLHRETGDRRGMAFALNDLGLLAMDQGDLPAAEAFLEESLSLARELGDKDGTAMYLTNLGVVALGQADYPQAVKLFEEGLTIAREVGDKQIIAGDLNGLGRVARFRGDCRQAAELQTESLSISRQMEDKYQTAGTLICLGELARLQGDYATACACGMEAEEITRELNDQGTMVYLIEETAAFGAAQGGVKRAATLFGAAQALRTAIHKVPLPVERNENNRIIALVRAQLGEATFDAAWAEGQTMTFEQAIACVLEQLDTASDQNKG